MMKVSKVLLAIVAAAMVASVCQAFPDPTTVCAQPNLDPNFVSRCNNCNGNTDCQTCVGAGFVIGSLNVADRCISCNGNGACYTCLYNAMGLGVRTGDLAAAANFADRCGNCNGNTNCLLCATEVMVNVPNFGLDVNTGLNTVGRCINCNGDSLCLSCVNFAITTSSTSASALNLMDSCTSQPSVSQCVELTSRFGADQATAASIATRCSVNGCGLDRDNVCPSCLWTAAANNDVDAADRCTQVLTNTEAAVCVRDLSNVYTRTSVADLGNRVGYMDNCKTCSYLGIGFNIYNACGACNAVAYLVQDSVLASKCSSLYGSGCNSNCQVCLLQSYIDFTVSHIFPTPADVVACFAL